jgi:nitric oxide reductase NorE protein
MKTENKNFYYPPGGILIWIIIIVELITFMGGLTAFAIFRNNNIDLALESQKHLNPLIGTINTIILITGGYFMAIGIKKLKIGDNKVASKMVLFAMIAGIAFLFLKGYEYYDKFVEGIGLSTNTFFTFYWLITGFHFIHVTVAILILLALYISIKKNKYTKDKFFDVETGGAFWHLCDLIWILVFPIFYLL